MATPKFCDFGHSRYVSDDPSGIVAVSSDGLDKSTEKHIVKLI